MDGGEDVDEFFALFTSDPEYLAASGDLPIDPAKVDQYVADSTRPGECRLAIRLRDSGRLVATATFLLPNPRDGHAWLGLVLVHRELQAHGFATELVIPIAQRLVAAGWPEIRGSVTQTNPDALQFWVNLGCSVIDERRDMDGRMCWILRMPLTQTV
jgi:RimJ/RimL family protein N-acetyltransferase